MVTLSIEAKHNITMCKRYIYNNLTVFLANEGGIISIRRGYKFFVSTCHDLQGMCQRLQSQLHNYSAYKLKIHWMRPAGIENKRMKRLKGSEVFSGSHQYAFLVGIDCCRQAGPPLFCQSHKSLFQAMNQRNHLALPIPSSPCCPHHSTM